MHHFTKHLKKKLWFHLILPIGSALVTVAVLDIIACFSWLFKDHGQVAHFLDDEAQLPFSILDILYWIFVTYRVVLSLLLCIGGIFMGRRPVVIIWLLLSILVDTIHLSETIFVICTPYFVKSWPLFISIASCIWGELKIIRIKYRIIRRTFNADWDTNTNDLYSNCSQLSLSLVESDKSDCGNSNGTVDKNYNSDDNCLADGKKSRSEDDQSQTTFCIQTNVTNFVKLGRNLYNLLTWHLTGFLFGGDFHKLLNKHKNYRAIFLEEKLIRYVRIFLDALTIVYILQEKKLLLTPWITLYILSGSALVAIFLFILLQLNLMTTLFITIYYVVFSIDLFFRMGFFLYCVRLIVKKKEIIFD